MKTCVAGQAVCPGLADVIANIIHERRIWAYEYHKVVRVGTDAHAIRSAGLADVPEPRRRLARVATAPKRHNLTFGADSAHPSEFDRSKGLDRTRGVEEHRARGQREERTGARLR